MKAIIEGKIVRFALVGDAVSFSVHVSSAVIKKNTFTFGTVVDFVVQPQKTATSDFNAMKQVEPLKTARCLAVGDEVSVELEKDKKGSWIVSAITHRPRLGQDVSEFLTCLEEELAIRRW